MRRPPTERERLLVRINMAAAEALRAPNMLRFSEIKPSIRVGCVVGMGVTCPAGCTTVHYHHYTNHDRPA